MKSITKFFLALLVAPFALNGCAGSGSSSSSSSLGSAKITILWPTANRLIPDGTQLVYVHLLTSPNGSDVVPAQAGTAPTASSGDQGPGKNQSTLVFKQIQPGTYTVKAFAYTPTTNPPTTSPTSEGYTSITITAGTATDFTVDMYSQAAQALFTYTVAGSGSPKTTVAPLNAPPTPISLPAGASLTSLSAVIEPAGSQPQNTLLLKAADITGTSTGALTLESPVATSGTFSASAVTVDGTGSGSVIVTYSDNDGVNRTFTLPVTVTVPGYPTTPSVTYSEPAKTTVNDIALDIDLAGSGGNKIGTPVAFSNLDNGGGKFTDEVVNLKTLTNLEAVGPTATPLTGSTATTLIGRLSGGYVTQVTKTPTVQSPLTLGGTSWTLKNLLAGTISDFRSTYSGGSAAPTYTYYFSSGSSVYSWAGGASTPSSQYTWTSTPSSIAAAKTFSPSGTLTDFIFAASANQVARLVAPSAAVSYPSYPVTDIANDSAIDATFGAPRLLYVLDTQASSVHILTWSGTWLEDVAIPSTTHNYHRLKVYAGKIFVSYDNGSGAFSVDEYDPS